jgi:alkylation response protein AidB-like acyl-CoA dehydrogenase
MVEQFAAAGLLAPPGDTARLLDLLTAIGSADLAIGRIYEGHVNARLLIDRFGTPAQRAAAAEAGMAGVWNTDGADALRLVRTAGGWVLAGGKSFASGAGLLDRALVTATWPDGGRQMVLVDMAPLAGRIDRSRWRPLGMRASMSFDVDFTGTPIEEAMLLGAPGDYLAEPWFSAGCIRFSAVQLGGGLALLRTVHRHLRQAGRADDPYQLERFARMRVALEGGRLWLARAAAEFDRPDAARDADGVIAIARMARHHIEEACLLVLDLANRSIGVQGMLAPHPAERLSRDLTTYLRQPAPDAALASIGRHALAAAELPW